MRYEAVRFIYVVYSGMLLYAACVVRYVTVIGVCVLCARNRHIGACPAVYLYAPLCY